MSELPAPEIRLPSLDRLRAIAEQARCQGCAELAEEVDRLAALAEDVVQAPVHCARCGGALQAERARLRLLFDGGQAGGCWRAALCVGCAGELRQWFLAAGGDLRGCEPPAAS